jgi:enoyl-CoA hydratase/carnithine racemase
MVNYSKKESVATVTLDRPDAQNCINAQVVGQFKDIRSEIQQDKDIRVVIVTAEGRKVFCAGTDTQAALEFEDRAKFLELFSVAAILDTLTCPVVAAINGAALGQGLELALACDLRICSQKASFAMPQVANGEMPWDGGTQRLARLVGRSKALEIVLLGENIDAQEALRIGLVHKVVPSGELMGTAEEIAQKIAEQSPISVAYAKEAIHKGMDLTLKQGLRLEADLYFLIHTTRDRTEGIKAFREKREPQFEGK